MDMRNIVMELKKEVDNLKILNRKVKHLEELHTYIDSEGFYKFIHEIQTELIPNLTLEELAKYIIDGTPIEREDDIKVKKVYS